MGNLDESLMFYLKIFENSHIYTVFSKILKKNQFSVEILMFYLKMITVIKNTMLISHIFTVFFSKILKKQLSVWMMLLIQRIQIHKWTQTKIKFWFLKHVMLKSVYKSIKIEFEYDSWVFFLSKTDFKTCMNLYTAEHTQDAKIFAENFTLVYLSYLLIK